ncbi:MAG: hypothetical protein J6M43_07090 [Neisseriaceae bacterium]|nr:hypothetical protein [Neisseriaceae bacterium]
MKKLSLLMLLAISLTACESINTALETANSVLETTGSVLGTNSSSSSTRSLGQGEVFARVPDKITKEYEIRNLVIYQKPAIVDKNRVKYFVSAEYYNKSNRYISIHISIPLYDTKGFNCSELDFGSGGLDKGEKSKSEDSTADGSFGLSEYPSECKPDLSKLKVYVNK